MGAAANAGNIRGSWDPQFNSYFTGVGFRGQITFFVPNDCLGSGTPGTTAYIGDGDSCSLDGMSLVDAEVVLYDTGDPQIVLSTITFAPPVQAPDPILGILVEYAPESDAVPGAWRVIGLDTDPIGPKLSDPEPLLDLPETFPQWLYLQFASGSASSPNIEDLPDAGAYLLPTTCSDCSPSYSTAEGDPNARSNRGVVAFVPEPGSLALLLSAMGVGWLARRRTAAR
jgi:hypothetical protein